MKDVESLKEIIKQHATLKDVLVEIGSIRGKGPEEQFSCPFHGRDLKKSCRYYEETDSAYCWVCKERWDIFSFTAKKQQITFSQVLWYLVKLHRIDVSKLPEVEEAAIEKIKNREPIKVNDRDVKLDNLRRAVLCLKEDFEIKRYSGAVFSYMLLKYMVPLEKFNDNYDKLRQVILKHIKKQDNK